VSRHSYLPDDELQSAAVLARACLLIQAAKDYGFVQGGAAIDVDRCEDVLAQAAERGITVSDADAELAAIELIREYNGAAE
jgi:hypothetical protein